MEINAVNVNEALSEGLHWLNVSGIKEESRNGPVIVSPEPVMTIYSEPRERVLFSPLRDANPFFHLMEALWMLAGRDDLQWPVFFNKQFAAYSDDGRSLHGAYGARWRNHFGYDQLGIIVDELQANPTSRRAVLAMWDPHRNNGSVCRHADDLHYIRIPGTKDAPCNTHAYFDVRGGRLNMTVMCRSNDILWGAYGANAVHFSILQEYLAAWLKVPVGLFRQFSNNFHLYLQVVPEEDILGLAADANDNNLYEDGVETFPLVRTSIDEWDEDLFHFINDPLGEIDRNKYRDPFFSQVAVPMFAAWHQRKSKYGSGLSDVANIQAEDWCIACTKWITRRETKLKEQHTNEHRR